MFAISCQKVNIMGIQRRNWKQEANSDLAELSNQNLKPMRTTNQKRMTICLMLTKKKGYRYMTSRLYEVMENMKICGKKGNE